MDENAVRRIFANLIQNMLKYGKKDVAITLKEQESYISSIFTNEAADMREEDVQHLFERFFTGNSARAIKVRD